MKIELLLLGRTKEAYLQQGIDDFASRLAAYNAIELIEIKTRKQGGKNDAQIMDYESELLEQRIRPGSYRVALDGRGRSYSSDAFADFLSALEDRAVKTLSFIIGGPLGLAPAQRERADTILSLSAMTFTHDLVRLLLLEQLYRAFAIKAGSRYHK